MTLMVDVYCRRLYIADHVIPACLDALNRAHQDLLAGCPFPMPLGGHTDLIAALAQWRLPASWTWMGVKLRGFMRVDWQSAPYEQMITVLAPFLEDDGQIWVLEKESIVWRYVIHGGIVGKDLGYLRWDYGITRLHEAARLISKAQGALLWHEDIPEVAAARPFVQQARGMLLDG